MDLHTLLSARRELDRGAAPLHDVAAAERELLASREDPPGSAWIQGAVRVIAAHQEEGRGERVWPLLRALEPMLPQLADRDAGRVLAAMATQALLEDDAEAFLDRTRRAVEALDRAGDEGAASVEHAAHGGALLALGFSDEAERALDTAIAGATRAGLVITAAAARLCRARQCLRVDGSEAASALAAAAADGFAASGQLHMEGKARAALASALASLMQGEDVFADSLLASDALAQAERAAAALANDPERALAAAALARAHLARGSAERALAALEGAPLASIGWLSDGPAPALLLLAATRALVRDAAGYSAAAAEAKRAVLAFASKLKRPEVRKSYLERIPAHRSALNL